MPQDALRDSFYDALQKFPILTGHLSRKGLISMQITVDENNLNLPVYGESTSTMRFRDLEENRFHRDVWPEGINIINPRVHSDGSGSSPKLIRVYTHRLAENSGFAIVIRISHSVFDAKGCVAFMNCWAQLCHERVDPNIPKRVTEPLIDRDAMYRCLPRDVQPTNRASWDPRTWLSMFLSLFVLLLLALYERLLSSKQASPDHIESHLFRLPRTVLVNLRNEIARLRPDSPRVSDNDIVTALFTMAFAQSNEQVAAETSANAGHVSKILKKAFGTRKKNISAIVPCDFRHRIGVPENYTGSCAIGLYVTAPRDILLGPMTLESIAKVASISRDTVDRVDRRMVEQFINRALRVINLVGAKANVLYSMMVCQAFSNQSRLGFYDINFGFGTPSLVVPMAYSNTVAVIVPSDPTSDGVDVFLTLRPRVMEVLLKKQYLDSFAELVY